MARLFRWAVERGYLERSPMEGIRPPGKEISRDRVLTDEELVEIWAAAGQLGYPFGALFQLLTLTAQRRGEVAALILQARREEAQRRGENPEKAEPPPRWTFHDLRRTAATHMARANVPPHVLAALLNHSPGRTLGISAIYIRHRYLAERRAALDEWAEHVIELAKDGPATVAQQA